MDRVSLKSQNAQFGFCSRGGSRILERVRFEEITASVKREPIMGSGGFAPSGSMCWSRGQGLCPLGFLDLDVAGPRNGLLRGLAV